MSGELKMGVVCLLEEGPEGPRPASSGEESHSKHTKVSHSVPYPPEVQITLTYFLQGD